MKSILADLRRSKTGIPTILNFGKKSHLEMSKIAKNSKLRAAQMVKMAVFGTSK